MAPLPIVVWDDTLYQSQLRDKVLCNIIKYGGDEGCWEWQGSKGHWGHGQVQIKETAHRRRKVMVHRLMWFWEHGDTEKVLDHLCGNPPCCNPRHLQPVTVKENTLRGNAPSAINAQRQKCVNGHPLYGDNLYVDRGRRRCRACMNQRSQEYKERNNYGRNGKGTRKYRSNKSGKKTHCVNGHDWIPENIIFRKSGRTECKVCHRLRQRARYRRNAARS